MKNIKRFRRYVLRNIITISVPLMPIFIIYIVNIMISRWHITPQVKYPVFRAPIVVIGSLIRIEIGTQNNSTSFMRIQVADKAMADTNRRWICDALPDQYEEAKAYCCKISFHCVSSISMIIPYDYEL